MSWRSKWRGRKAAGEDRGRTGGTALLGLLVAIYGAGVSTVLAINELKADDKRALITASWIPGGCGVAGMLEVTVTNLSSRPLTVKKVEASARPRALGGGRFIAPTRPVVVKRSGKRWRVRSGSWNLPRRLEQGDTASWRFDVRRLLRGVVVSGSPRSVIDTFHVLDVEGGVGVVEPKQLLDVINRTFYRRTRRTGIRCRQPNDTAVVEVRGRWTW